MKILLVTNMFHPDFCGGAALFTDLAEGLRERGHEVTVYAAFPYYPEWEDKSGNNGWSRRQEMHGDISVVRHGVYIPKTPGKLLPRLVFELSFLFSLMRSLWRGPRQDVVVTFCPMFGAVIFGVFRKWLRGERIWLTVQDIPADAASAAGISKSRMFDSVASWLQRFIFNRTDGWSSITPGMVERLESLKSPGRREIPIKLFPNWLTGIQAKSVERFAKQVPTRGEGPLQLLYCGNIGKKQGLLAFCQRLKQTDIEFHFQIRGEGSAADEVQMWIRNESDDRFSMSGFLGDDEFISAIHAADWFVITEKAGAGFSFIPSKLIPCISVGTPLLAICDADGPLGREVIGHDLGLSVAWDDLDDLSKRLDASDEEKRASIRAACLERAKAYHRETAITNYEQAFEGLLA